MSKEIQEFIEKLKDWKSNFPIQDYDYTKYNCEVADIARWQRENNANRLINFWNEKFKNYSLILKHPIFNNIETKAIHSFFDGNVLNSVFMIDSNNQHPWIFIQCFRSINLLVCKEKAYCIFEDNKGYNFSLLKTASEYFSKINQFGLSYKDMEFGISLQNARPMHFFYMLLNHLIRMKIDNKHILVEKYCYFIPNFLYKNCVTAKENMVYIQPTVIPTHCHDAILNELIVKDSINTKNYSFDFNFDLKLWLGLPGERRAWLEQIEGVANILKNFNRYFNKIKVYIDGMTACDGERKDFPENKILFDKVVNTTRKLFLEECNKNIIFIFEELQESISDSIVNEERFIVFKSLAGYDYRTKICYCNDCDIAIGDSGTTALVPFVFYHKPGVIFYGELSTYYINYSKNLANGIYQRVVDEKLVKQVDRKSFLVWNYHIPPQHIYNLAAEVLEELSVVDKLKIKNLKMHRLDVPPVELVNKQYELEQKLQIKLPMESVALYNALEKQINTLALGNNTTLNQTLENINTNNTLNSTLQHSLQTKVQTIQNLENKIKDIEFKFYFKTAKARIQNHLSYKLGQAMIINSKSLLGYIRMPFVLSYMKDKHKQEQKIYQEKIKRDPSLKLPPLENYPDYKEALKEKECLTYKLGQALIKADQEWYKGGYVKMWFEVRKLKRKFKDKYADKNR